MLLGDYFDSYSDTAAQNAATAEWAKARLHDPHFVFLLGNHDTHYLWPENGWVRCSGFHESKSTAINAVLKDEDWARFRAYYAVPSLNLLFTHAGFHRSLHRVIAGAELPAPAEDPTLSRLTEWLDSQWPAVVGRYEAGSLHPLLEAGADRSGFQRICGGITWCDFDSFVPIPGLAQVMGHTPRDHPLFRFHQGAGAARGCPMWRRASVMRDTEPSRYGPWLAGGWGLDLDTHLHHYALVDTDLRTLTIKEVRWRRARGDIHPHVEPAGIVCCISLIPSQDRETPLDPPSQVAP